MTQEQALAICVELFPDAEIQLDRSHCIGVQRGTMDEFKVWDWTSGPKILASSERSWEHCIDILKTQAEHLYPQDDSPVEVSAE